jgi:chemotaxis response regulator CheB
VSALKVVLATSDALFAALCTRALAATRLELVAAVSPIALLETVRELAPDLLVLDADVDDPQALKVLASKAMLVSEARIVLVGSWLAPGSPGLSALLQAIAATFVHKPGGPSSLGLAASDGPPFVAALEAAYVAHENRDLAAVPKNDLPPDFDAGWEST